MRMLRGARTGFVRGGVGVDLGRMAIGVLALGVALIADPRPAGAQEVFVTDEVESLALSNGTVFWATDCGGEFAPPRSRVRGKPAGGGFEFSVYFPSLCTGDRVHSSNVAFDRSYAYWTTGDGGIVRKLRSGSSASSPPETLTTMAGSPIIFPGPSVAVLGDHVYWSEEQNLYRVPKTGGLRDFQFGVSSGPIRDLVADRVSGTLWFRSGNVVFRATETGLDPPFEWLIASIGRATAFALANGRVYRADGPATGGAVTIRSETTSGGGDQVHASIDPTGNPVVGTLTADSVNLYWQETRGALGPIVRLRLSGGTRDELTANIGGTRLVTDGRYLFWTASGPRSILRLPVNAAAVTQDLSADWLEVVQVIQRSDGPIGGPSNDVPLVMRKPTWARLFGRIRASSSGLTRIRPWPAALLHGFRADGSVLPGSPLSPEPGDIGLFDRVGDRLAVDPRGRPEEGYLFRLPPAWAEPGEVVLRGEINPSRVVAETSFANNDVIETVTFGREAPICMVVKPVRTPVGSVGSWSPRIQPILDRAEAVLPTPELRVYWPGGGAWEEYEFPFSSGPYELSRSDDDSGWVLFRLNAHKVFADDPDRCDAQNALTDFLVFIPAAHPNPPFNGVASGDATIVWERYGLDPSGSLQNRPTGGITLGHEIGHLYGRPHVNCAPGDPADPDGSYPYPPCQLDFNRPNANVGFDPISRLLVDPTTTGDLLSYAHRISTVGAGADRPRWPSDYTWERIKSEVPTPPSVPAPPPATSSVLVSGRLSAADGRVDLDYAFELDPASLARATARLAGRVPSATLRLDALDPTGAVLTVHPVWTFAESENPPGDLGILSLYDGAASPAALAIVDVSGPVPAQLGRLGSGAGIPAVTILSPLAGQRFGTTLPIEWKGQDPDGDFLRYSVRYSADKGNTWQLLAWQTPFSQLVRDTSGLPGCTASCAVQVTASDGLHSTTVTSGLFTVDPGPPDATIFFETPDAFGLTGRAVIPQSATVILHGRGYDDEDGPLGDAALGWVLAGPEPRTGSGRRLPQSGLRPGEYLVDLTATDSQGQTGTAIAALEVEPKAVPDASAPLLDGVCDDVPYLVDVDPVRLPHVGGDVAQLRTVHADGGLYACFSGLPRTIGPGALERVGLWFDRDASGGAFLTPNEIGFSVDESGVFFLATGGGKGEVIEAPLGPGLDARVTQTDTSWSAELRIEEIVLGGWNHLVRMHAFQRSVGPSPVVRARWPNASSETVPDGWGDAMLGTLGRVRIDIQPGEEPNFVDTNGADPVAVAVLGSTVLPVQSLDVSDLRFGPLLPLPIEDLTDPTVLANALGDVNSDKIDDLLIHYAVAATGLGPDDTHGCLEGRVLQGRAFVACDSIVPTCNPQRCDFDGDGVPDVVDNCETVPNSSQDDPDQDQRGSRCDTCPFVAFADQSDLDGNGIGDACQCGDVNGDFRTDVVDALAIARGQVSSQDPNFGKCDVDGDGNCNVVDALIIARGELSSDPASQKCPAWFGQ